MKMGLKLSVCFLISLIFAISCKKSGDEAIDCISDVIDNQHSMASTVDPSQLIVIDNLFARNNLSTAGQQFFGIDSNRIKINGNPDSVNQIAVLSYLWVNNLPVFLWNNNYIFYNGVLRDRSIVYTGAMPGPDTSYRQNLEDLRRIYLRTHSSFRDSCLTAQRGYIDPSFINRSLPYGKGFVKAWKISPVGSNNPMIIVEDDNGAVYAVALFYP
jgi:hypothetical protein